MRMQKSGYSATTGRDLPDRMAQFFRSMGDATRIKILLCLADAEQCVGQLAEDLHLSESTISHHLRLLRINHLVKCRRGGKSIFYTISDATVRSALHLVNEHLLEQEKNK